MPHDHGQDHDHPHDHGHDHGHHHPEADLGDRRVAAAILVNILLTLVQIVAGVVSGSLALVADAIHNLSDALSLVIAFAARRVARRGADRDMTFGYGRAEVVAALVNYVSLVVVALYLAAEGVQRLFAPQEVEGWIVVVVAAVALVIDTATALLVWRLSRDSMNLRAAFLHNVADALGSVAVIVGGTLILLYDWRLVDPIVTLGISGYILWHSYLGLKPAVKVLMLAAPDSPGVEPVLDALCATPGVASVHHLHLWRMQEHEVALEAHVVLHADADAETVRRAIRDDLALTFGVEHSTLQMELPGAACEGAPVIGH